MSQVYDICSPKFFLIAGGVTFEGFMQCTTAAFETWTLYPSYSLTRGRHSNVMSFADLINVYAWR